MAKPIIGISSDFDRLFAKTMLFERNIVHDKYAIAVEKAGGVPVIIPILESEDNLEPLLEKLDGIILTGGNDMRPELYQEGLHEKTSLMHPRREKHDLLLARKVLDSKLPFLGICGGMQLLNVVAGGSLYRDIADEYKSTQPHLMIGNSYFHSVAITEGSRLESIVGKKEIETNSLHHQSIKNVGKGFRAVARAADGVIEAIEIESSHFGLGIQWHPELLTNMPEHIALFKSLIQNS